MIRSTLAKISDGPRGRQKAGFIIGGSIGLIATVLLALPDTRAWHEPGPRNTGHAKLACTACHRVSQGTLRQRVQARVTQLLDDQRRSMSTIGYTPVGNADCLACHLMNKKDAHAVYRFMEPRFAAVRATLAPQLCISCHKEHSGVRVTAGGLACAECHDKIALKKDRLDVPHATLAAQQRWDTCLGCHDYHGNHAFLSPTRLHDAVATGQVTTYLRGGASPYGEAVLRAKSTREDNDHEI